MPANEAPLSIGVRFILTVDGYDLGSFSKLAGLVSRVESVDAMRSLGNETQLLDRFAAARTRTELSFVRSKSNDSRLSAWCLSASRNSLTSAKTCTLRLYDIDGKPVAQYSLEKAWPSKINISGPTAPGTPTGLSETVTFTCECIRRIAAHVEPVGRPRP